MVDLTLFHKVPGGNYAFADYICNRKGRLACYFLEWTGWYNNRIAARLLGHYRLFQLYKRDPDHAFRDMPLSQAYILHYRSSHSVKYFISRIISFIYCIGTLGRHYLMVEIETFNRSLIHDHAGILQTFLEQADHDFTSAFHTAMAKLNERILSVTDTPVIQATRKGKEKDVFSKKQVLILFDLLSSTSKLEPIALGKPAKFEAIAALLHALTGRSKDSWTEELNDYKIKDLYAFHSQGELQQLINTLSNLAEFLRKAGFRSLTTLADKKIRELERHKKDS